MVMFVILKPSARQFVVTYLKSIDNDGIGQSVAPTAWEKNWAICSAPVISFASME